MTDHLKVQAPAKSVHVRSEKLSQKILQTMKIISDIVGATLGPGGAPVLIERQDFGMAPAISKDGVSVFQSLGFQDEVAQSIMESARDCAVRTVSAAGDGTTTSTVLAYALVREAQEYRKKHPEVSPQKIVQTIQRVFEEVIEPRIKEWSTPVNIATKEGMDLCRAVATISANGETQLADSIMKCFSIIGDSGNVSLSEKSGPSGYEVERVDGFPIATGMEESCGRFLSVFQNDPANNRVFLEKPVVVLYNGVLTDFGTVLPILNILKEAADQGIMPAENRIAERPSLPNNNVIVVAHGFSTEVLGMFSMNWSARSLHVYPVVTPKTGMSMSETFFLEDLSVVTGAKVFNPVSCPLDSAQALESDEDGNVLQIPWAGHADSFEALRFRSTVLGIADEEAVIARATVLEGMAKTAASELDRRLIEERRCALLGGIAKLYVVGSSSGDIRERRDRCDDAVRGVQGAIKAGVLPGGGHTLLYLIGVLKSKYAENNIVTEVLIPALREPFYRLLANTGMTDEQISDVESAIGIDNVVYDASSYKMVDAFESGILDSTPAVLEAIRSAISIATLLGTLGGVVVFQRDKKLEIEEAESALSYERNMTSNIMDSHW